MSKWCASCVILLRLEKEKEPEGWKQLPVGCIDGISCQHLQVLMTQLFGEWQEHRRNNLWHGSERRPTMYLACMDIKTAFDVARPTQNAKNMGDHEVQRWITAALLRKMAGLEGHATFFENVESTFPFARRIRQRSVEAPRPKEEITKSAVSCGRTSIGSCVTQRRTWSTR